MYNRVYNHISSNHLLFDKQFGFQQNSSTEHAILELANNIAGSFEKGEYTLGVFIDLSKAFDTVNHEILLKKLESYDIIGTTLKWLKSYLNERKQFINCEDNSKIELRNITCGVPQGSILGPLQFLLYVNDLYKAVDLII